ncbi:hypothetical protein J0A68_01070 [Algoriphagus sp. H41]|uniref:Uncharacterized protein n=1 Tax=Algoriphagus oliviformis TaxID=2811231 RepID=A0ABS3BXE7_9BACT|nr:hypothetical protein [Algoriphagus oliviformis]MBN7809525.1 hypothetical protein [Algoriphagus oliviformis]
MKKQALPYLFSSGLHRTGQNDPVWGKSEVAYLTPPLPDIAALIGTGFLEERESIG